MYFYIQTAMYTGMYITLIMYRRKFYKITVSEEFHQDELLSSENFDKIEGGWGHLELEEVGYNVLIWYHVWFGA